MAERFLGKEEASSSNLLVDSINRDALCPKGTSQRFYPLDSLER